MKLEYNIIYSTRKTLRITVERDRSIVVRAPHGTLPTDIDQLIKKKKFWIYQKTKHEQKYKSEINRKEFISGSTILYLGKSYKLNVISESFEGILFDNEFLISKASVPYAPELFRTWFIKQAKEKIVPQVKTYALQLGVEYNRILISDLKYRWGSCTPKDNLNFNWRLIKAPMRVIEYIIVHELAHLIEPNHTAQFWSIVKTQIPDYQSSKDWLKEHGQLLEEVP
jgi:predicted metal-dependent hydrolase